MRPLQVVVRWLISALSLLAAAAILPGVSIDGFFGAVVVAAVIAVINAALLPLIAALRLPFTLILNFLLVLVADAWMLMAADALTDRAISVGSFWRALLTALVAALWPAWRLRRIAPAALLRRFSNER
jgi:putative membrane protein